MGILSSVGKTVAKKALINPVTKDLAKYEASKNIPVVGAFIPSRTGQMVNFNNKMKARTAQFGNAGELNKKTPSPEKIAQLGGLVEDMEKLSSTNWGDVAKYTAISAAVPMAITGGIYGANKIYQKTKSESVWKALKKKHPELTTSADRENFEVLQQFNPSMATNVTTARGFLQRTQNTYVMPHEFVGELANNQSRMNQNSITPELARSTQGAFDTGVRMSADRERMSLDYNKFDHQKQKDQEADQFNKDRLSLEQRKLDESFISRREDLASRRKSEKARAKILKQQHSEKMKLDREKFDWQKRNQPKQNQRFAGGGSFP